MFFVSHKSNLPKRISVLFLQLHFHQQLYVFSCPEQLTRCSLSGTLRLQNDPRYLCPLRQLIDVMSDVKTRPGQLKDNANKRNRDQPEIQSRQRQRQPTNSLGQVLEMLAHPQIFVIQVLIMVLVSMRFLVSIPWCSAKGKSQFFLVWINYLFTNLYLLLNRSDRNCPKNRVNKKR